MPSPTGTVSDRNPFGKLISQPSKSSFSQSARMKCCSLRLGPAQRLLALSVSLAIILSTPAFSFARNATPNQPKQTASQEPAAGKDELQLLSVRATPTESGILLEWHTTAAPDNIGFNVYRVKNGERERANRQLVPGVQFSAGPPALRRGGYSFSWIDRDGTPDSVYFIESVNADGEAKIHQPVVPVPGVMSREFKLSQSQQSAGGNESANTFASQSSALDTQLPNVVTGTLQDQWALVAQSALKIGIKKNGWYRVTQPQMVAAGFNSAVDIRNLRLFLNATELAISTSQSSGQFAGPDYIEFYGQGLDTATTDVNTYYLIAGTTPGKRVGGEFQVDAPPPSATPPPIVPPVDPPAVPPVTSPINPAADGPVLRDPIFFSWTERDLRMLGESLRPPVGALTATQEKVRANNDNGSDNLIGDYSLFNSTVPDNAPDSAKTEPRVDARPKTESQKTDAEIAPALTNTNGPGPITSASVTAASAKPLAARSGRRSRRSAPKRKTRRVRQLSKQAHHHHAMLADGYAPVNFVSAIDFKERFNYVPNILNGETENFFGRGISTTPATFPVNVSNLDTSATTQATLEFGLQGLLNTNTGAPHRVTVAINNVTIGSPVDFTAIEHAVRSFSFPISLLQNNAPNQITFTKTSTGEICLFDYLRLSYPHTFKADSDALRFNLLGTQTLKVDGFSTPLVRLIDYSDPFNVSISKAVAETSASGYAITVPTSETAGKSQRFLYAIPLTQFDQPATITLNQPQTLNTGALSGSATQGADFLLISYKTFIPNLAPLVSLRQSQGKTVAVIDVEDIYDEFGFGQHEPQAIKAFLSHAATSSQWVKKPAYIIFAGDGSMDPRNYELVGNFDFVPTKLVDTQFNETCSDDWLADFDDNGIADIPIGRLPIRSVADANLIISKLVNFSPAAVPDDALLVADDPTGYYFNFETANDQVAALLQPLTVHKVYKRLDGANTHQNIVDNFNSGSALVNYSGHGNVDIWAGGGGVFNTNDALSLTNSNKLSFVVVMDCLNGYFQDPLLLAMAEAFLKAQNGGAVATFASSGLTFPEGQHEMSEHLYTLIYGPGAQPIALGDAIKAAKAATSDSDVRRTWIYFGDPSIKIR